jgi:hypothetical protein
MAQDPDNSSARQDGPVAGPAVARRTKSTFEVDRRHVWITAPLVIAFLGLVGTGLGALIQQYSTTLLERNKFEYTLIQKALAAPNRHDAAKELTFYSKIGLLRGLTEGKITEATKGEAEELPVFHGAALRNKTINVQQAKAVLKYLTEQNDLSDPKGPSFYTGPIDDKFDLNFEIAIMRFQKEKKIDIDGLIGAKTVLSMWDACSRCPALLQEAGTSSPSK